MPLPLWRIRRILRTVLVASAFVGFWSGGFLLAWIVLPIIALFSKRPREACQGFVARSFQFFHGYMRTLRLLDARVQGTLAPELGGQPVVFIANHTTLVDVTAIVASIPNVYAVAKTNYAKSPLVGRLLHLAGFIDAGSSVASRAAMVDRCIAQLASGGHVLVFPEGTRSPEGGLSRFQRGAFEIACRANVPIVPLFLRCNPSALRKDQRFWNHPDECALLSIEIGQPIYPAAYDGGSRRMRSALEGQYRERLGVLTHRVASMPDPLNSETVIFTEYNDGRVPRGNPRTSTESHA